MKALTEELQDNQHYVALLDALVEENDIEMKNRLQKADTYGRFINEQAGILMDKTIDHIREENASFQIASSIVLEEWKDRIFS